MAKGNSTEQFIDLDSGIAPLTGKRVFYQLTDVEGGTDEPDGRKSPAVIVKNLRGKRDAEGRLVSRLLVFPCDGEQPFSVEAPSDSSRTPGTWDNHQPGDKRN